jgi:hypothetical protein
MEKAQVWKRTDIPSMNLRVGPGGVGAFRPAESVTCEYAGVPPHGKSLKFYCSIGHEVLKVRYGDRNGEVEGSVLATRLLWALGFAADRVYPVRVRCVGCSTDPWNHRGLSAGVSEFDPAVIERDPPGHEMREGNKKAEWTWPELALVDESQGGAPRAQRDALKLLAVFMQHGDTKAQQQRLLCVSGELTAEGTCKEPFLLLHDVGLTFGHANVLNRNSIGSVNLAEWARAPIWRNAHACIGHLSGTHSGTLEDPHISEAGRQFLANLLVQLSDAQVRDLFEVAQVERRTPSARVEDWVAVFDRKRTEILTNRCPN